MPRTDGTRLVPLVRRDHCEQCKRLIRWQKLVLAGTASFDEHFAPRFKLCHRCTAEAFSLRDITATAP